MQGKAGFFFWQRILYATFLKQEERRDPEHTASKNGLAFIKVKKNFTLEQATKAEKRSRGIALLFP